MPLGALALVAVFVFAGCGETVIDTTKIEEQVKSDLEASLPTRTDLQKELGIAKNETITEVDCPSGVEVKAGNTFVCQITFVSGAGAKETFEIDNEKADVHQIGALEPTDGSNE